MSRNSLPLVGSWIMSLVLGLLPGLLTAQDAAAPATPDSASEASSETHSLKYKFQAGEKVRFLTEHLATTLTRITLQESPGRSRTVTIKIWLIKEVKSDGSIVFEQSIERLVLSQLVGESDEIRYDSRSTEAPPLRYESISETIGVPLALVTISPSGEILEKEAIYEDFQMGLDDVAMPLPPEPIAVGGTWYSPHDFTCADQDGLQVLIKLRKAYTLQRVSNGIATIGMKTEVLTPVVEPRIEAQLIQELTAGTIQFDLERGRVLNKDMKWDEEVVGFSSPQSYMEFHGRFSERLLEDGEDPTLSVDTGASTASSETPATEGPEASVAENPMTPPATETTSPATQTTPSTTPNQTENRSILIRPRDSGPVLRK